MVKQLQPQESMAGFLRETAFVDYSAENIRTKTDELFSGRIYEISTDSDNIEDRRVQTGVH